MFVCRTRFARPHEHRECQARNDDGVNCHRKSPLTFGEISQLWVIWFHAYAWEIVIVSDSALTLAFVLFGLGISIQCDNYHLHKIHTALSKQMRFSPWICLFIFVVVFVVVYCFYLMPAFTPAPQHTNSQSSKIIRKSIRFALHSALIRPS